jgi:hypothetical protein
MRTTVRALLNKLYQAEPWAMGSEVPKFDVFFGAKMRSLIKALVP